MYVGNSYVNKLVFTELKDTAVGWQLSYASFIQLR